MRENLPESTELAIAPTEPVPWGSPPPEAVRAPAASQTLPPVHPSGPATPEAPDDEPFVPAPRWRAGRLTKALVCVCLVLAGGLGGAALQKAVDSSGVSGRTGQFQVGTQNGNGTGTGGQTGGFGGRNRASQAPSSAPTAAP